MSTTSTFQSKDTVLVAREETRSLTTQYVVTVDTEEEWDWNSGWPTGKPSVSNIQQLPEFQAICDRHQASVTYFTNLAVLDDDRAAGTMQSIAKQPGVEIGMHIHPWNTPPVATGCTARQSFLANYDPQIIRNKLSSVLDRFHDRGLQPTSFRGGRYSSGPVVQSFLAEHGFVADTSVVPFTTWHDDGAPDYRDRDLQPRRLLYQDKPLWEIPLTMGYSRRPFGFWQKTLERVEHSPLRHLRLIGIADRLNLVRRVWLSFEDPLGEHMLQFLHLLRGMCLPCVVFTLHSSSLAVSANGSYTNTKQDQDRLFSQLDTVLRTLAGWPEFQPATMTQIAQRLEESHHARSRN